MAQIRHPPRYRSPPPRQIPSLPNPIRFRPSTQNTDRPITRAMPSPPPPPPRNDISYNKQYDPVSGLMIDTNNFEQSLSSLTSSNQLPLIERQAPLSENNNITEESIIFPQLNDDDDELLDKKHLPVYARFPFDISLLPHPMEINIEDNIHKLRLRLINSELNHQRRSTAEYIKRTHRIGMDNDLPNSSDIEREFEIRRIQESSNNRRRSNQKLMISNYLYDPRLHLQPLNEENIYTTSNVDDLIDSMARRHLASRRLDAAIDRQRHSNGYHDLSIEPLNTGRMSHRNDDLLYPNRSSRNHIERDSARRNSNGLNQMLRSRIDYYDRIQPDLDGMNNDDLIRTNSDTKLPPISSEHDSNRFNHSQNPSTSTLYDTKKNAHMNQSLSEHLFDLPSDIFLSPRTKTLNSSERTRKIRPRSISQDTRSGTDRSDRGSEVPMINHRKTDSQNSHDGFFTESSSHQQKFKTKSRRNLFQKAAIGILFPITLKNQSIKNRSHRPKQSPSATIHKIRLQEIIVALHRVYLEPDGPIYNALIQAITNPISLQNGLNSSSKNYSEVIKIIGNALKNIIATLIEFMPKDGVLGTEKTSAISALIQDGNPFPENYFWQCEREHLEFDNLKVIHITKQRAILLLIGIFIFRALVTTLLIKPIKYRLILGQLTPKQSISLKVFASVILYIGRQVAGPNSQILTLPDEWQLSLYTDADIQPIIQHLEMKSIIEICEQSLYMWCEEYIRRIDQNIGKESRI